MAKSVTSRARRWRFWRGVARTGDDGRRSQLSASKLRILALGDNQEVEQVLTVKFRALSRVGYIAVPTVITLA